VNIGLLRPSLAVESRSRKIRSPVQPHFPLYPKGETGIRSRQSVPPDNPSRRLTRRQRRGSCWRSARNLTCLPIVHLEKLLVLSCSTNAFGQHTGALATAAAETTARKMAKRMVGRAIILYGGVNVGSGSPNWCLQSSLLYKMGVKFSQSLCRTVVQHSNVKQGRRERKETTVQPRSESVSYFYQRPHLEFIPSGDRSDCSARHGRRNGRGLVERR
jgi:hypothetical protein